MTHVLYARSPRWMTLVAVAVMTLLSASPADSLGADPPTVAITTVPSSQPAPLDPEVERILDRLERKGDTVKDLEATIHYAKIDRVLNDKQKYEGILRFKQDRPNPRFFIRFDRCIHDGKLSRKKEWHVFDGRWYIEARERTHLIIEREQLRPGEERELFRLGQGPFPLPFGQKKADIVRHFDVKLAPLTDEDLAVAKMVKGTKHLACTPRPGTRLAREYETVHFYIDPREDLPVCLRTVQKEQDTEIVVSFPAIKTNVGLAASKLNLPDLRGYERRQERLDPPPPGPPGDKR